MKKFMDENQIIIKSRKISSDFRFQDSFTAHFLSYLFPG